MDEIRLHLRTSLIVCRRALGLGLLLALIDCSRQSHNTAGVAAELVDLKQPYRSVEASYWLDGGSITMTIVDAGGESVQLDLPNPIARPTGYSRIHIKGPRGPGRELTDPVPTRRMLVLILESKKSRTVDEDVALEALKRVQ